jgi:hypothetical protein
MICSREPVRGAYIEGLQLQMTARLQSKLRLAAPTVLLFSRKVVQPIFPCAG